MTERVAIADLLHFGVPDDLHGFQDPALPERFRAYAAAFAEQDRILAYVSYTGIVLTDTTNNVTELVADASWCFSPDVHNLCP